ncbi:MAG: SPW repeat domain-containing protein [bacterium]
MHERPTERQERSDPLKEHLHHLEELRSQQSLLQKAREGELREQDKHDAEAQRLMETDPAGHVEMMRSMQEHAAVVRELPEKLLEHEAAVYEEIAREQEPLIPEPLAKPLMADHVVREQWAHIAVMPLGAWLIASPFMFAYPRAATAWSDILSGILVIALAALSYRGALWAPFANAGIGLWVMFAPLLFWAPDPASYANDTLIGALVTTFAVIIPMRIAMPGPDVPPEWSYNPSTWPQRGPIVALAIVSYLMARYMSAFQLGHIESVWDPFFRDGTMLVLTSEVSKAFPISDAGLGAYTYMIEILSGLMGDERRWRTMPWMVALFGIAVIPLGIVSVVLIILQPIAVGAWCTFCLISAVLMLIMAALSLDEVLASIQFLLISKRAGRSVWVTFWNGGNLPERVADIGLSRGEVGPWAGMFGGATFPWTLGVSALLGVWLMASPDIFNSVAGAADSDHLLGALVVVVAITAMAEVGRAFRFFNILLALAIVVAPWVLSGAPFVARLNNLAAGVLLIALSLPRGKIQNRYGGWNPFIV